MEYLQTVIYQLVELGSLSVIEKEGRIDLSVILEEAVKNGIIPRNVINEIESLIELK